MIAADVGYGQLGTSGAATSESNTGLGTAVPATEFSVDITATTKTLQFDYTLPSTVGTSTTYQEYSMYGSGTAYIYDRILFTGVTHTEAEDLIITKVYYIEGA